MRESHIRTERTRACGLPIHHQDVDGWGPCATSMRRSRDKGWLRGVGPTSSKRDRKALFTLFVRFN